jgi:hypothetical protein
VEVNFKIHKTIRIVSNPTIICEELQESRINQSILSRISWREMFSLHEAAQHGRLEECRRLVEKEGKDVHEANEVNICMISSMCMKLKLANISHSNKNG